VNDDFEKWASSKGLALEDPITQMAREAYRKGGSDASVWWMPRFSAAIDVVQKNGLQKEYDERLQQMEELLKLGFANSSKGPRRVLKKGRECTDIW
jgi:hypothetical protein